METKLNKKVPNFNVSVTGNSKLDTRSHTKPYIDTFATKVATLSNS